MSDRIAALHRHGGTLLAEFLEQFEPTQRCDYKLTLVARNALYPDGSRDVLITDEKELVHLIGAIQRLSKRPEVAP